MRFIIYITLLLLISACATSLPPSDPSVKQALGEAQEALNQCLLKELVKIDDGTTDAALLARVMAGQCQYTAMLEAKKLKELNTNPYFIDGFNKMYTSKSEITDVALTMVMKVRAHIYSELAAERKAKLKAKKASQ